VLGILAYVMFENIDSMTYLPDIFSIVEPIV